jgi:protein tyrosine/serine phosphatase
MVADGLYRGGQPDEEDFETLKEFGIKTIINLRTENGEKAVVEELGMNYIHIPITITPFSRIPAKAIDKYFEVVNNPANYPIFFHCRRGADRTGAMAGFYRMAAQGWDSRKAYSEARDIGFRWWYPRIKEQILKFNRDSYAALSPATATQ